MALIDGSSKLSKHFGSDNDFFWMFPLNYIEEIPELDRFLRKNGWLDAHSLYKKECPQTDLYLKYYMAPLAQYKGDKVLVGSPLRFILYNYCVHLLDKDLEKFSSNVKKTDGIRYEEKNGKGISYSASDDLHLFTVFLREVRNPLSIRFLIQGPVYTSLFGDRYYINLAKIEEVRERVSELYDFSRFSIE